MQMSLQVRSVSDDGSREANDEIQELMDALSDADCRLILGATDEPLTTAEIAAACELPLSTTYRKVDSLSATPLLRETTRFDPNGDHASEYVCTIDGLDIELTPHGIDVELDLKAEHAASDRSIAPSIASAD
ncbi:MAG: helix-turn-helix domain-containing protein [Halobacteriota archaeon]